MSAVVVSIVSHGHGPQVRALVRQIAAQARQQRAEQGAADVGMVVLTLNQAEPALAEALQADGQRQPWPFELVVHENRDSQGFGANHNQAWRDHARLHWLDRGTPLNAACFAVVNPDIELIGNPFPALLAQLADQPALGCVCPVQVDAAGHPQDFARRLPTPLSIARRGLWLLRRRLGLPHADQPPGQVPAGQPPDWVNAAFWLVRAKAWRAVGGFDTRYFMYGEDVDWCLRLQLAGWGLAVVPGAQVRHVAQRSSRRNVRHLAWHLGSLWRLWRSPVWRAWRSGRQN